MDLKSREVFKARSKIIKEIRSFMNKKGFMEVETPCPSNRFMEEPMPFLLKQNIGV